MKLKKLIKSNKANNKKKKDIKYVKCVANH